MPLIVTQGMGADDLPEREYLVRQGLDLDVPDNAISLATDTDINIDIQIEDTEIETENTDISIENNNINISI